jgi:molybdate transport system ATP-binding protein
MAPLLEARFEKNIGSFHLDVELDMGREICVLFGPSGSGKSQTLRLLAGLSRPDRGHLFLNGREVLRCPRGCWTPSRDRNVGLVFQDLALFPHLSVKENVAYGIAGSDRKARAEEWLERCHLAGYGDRFPRQLSGGQRQRAALARALAPEPDLLLLDEPFSALDAPLRSSLRRELKKLHRETGIPVLYVTHQIEDVCALGDRIFFIRDGKIARQMPVENLWNSSSQEGLWETLGWGNIIHGTIEASRGGLWLRWNDGRLELPPSTTVRGSVTAFVAPHHLKILYPDLPVSPQLAMNILEGTVTEKLDLGSTRRIYISAGGFQWQMECPAEAYGNLHLGEGTPVRFAVMPRNICLLGEDHESGSGKQPARCSETESEVLTAR